MTEPLTDEERAPWTDTELQLEQQALAEKREEWLAETNRQKRDLLRDILVFATRAFASIADLKRLLEMANGCLNMVAERLEALGCACKDQHVRAETPPMMYPEWIDCVISARIAERDRRIEAAEELIATMEGYPGEAHGADEWYCERMEKDIAAYRKDYPAKKED